MSKDEKRGRGRPPKQGRAMLAPITIRLPEDMDKRIQAICDRRLDAPDKSTVIRELLAKALKDEEVPSAKVVELRRRK